MWKRTALVVALMVLALATYLVIKVTPRFLIGLAMYGGQAREGSLVVGDLAPDVNLVSVESATGDGGTHALSEWIGPRPLVLVFGSFT